MPRIPLLQEGPVRRAETPRGDILAQETLAIGQAVSQVTTTAANFLTNLQRSQDANDLSSALAFSANSRTENNALIKEDVAGFSDATKKYEAHEKLITEQVSKQWPRAFKTWQIDDLKHSDAGRTKIGAWQSKRSIDHQQANLVTTERVWKDEAVRAVDDVSLGIATANYFKALDDAVITGGLTELQAITRKEDFAVSVTSARVDRDIDANPQAALEKLNAGGYAIGEIKRLDKIDKAEVAVAQERKDITKEQEDAEKRADEAKKEEQEANAVEYTAQLAEGVPLNKQKATDDLRTGKITRKFFESLMKETVIGDKSDPDELLEVDVRVTNNTISQSEILENPRLTAADKSARIKTLASVQDKAFQRQLKDGESELRAVIISTGPLAKFVKGEEQERMEFAKNELADRLTEGKDSLREILDDMLPRFRATVQKATSLPTPRLSRSRPTNVLQLKNQRENLKRQLSFMNPNEAEEEAELLEAYEQIIQQEDIK
jgi:hypothetical protein